MMLYPEGPYRVSGKATTAFSSSVLIPARWAGFIGATAIVAVHLVVITTVVDLFALHTDKSELGNLWQTLAQVVTTDTVPVLGRAGNLQDEEVDRLIRLQYPELRGDQVLRRETNGQITLRTGHEAG